MAATLLALGPAVLIGRSMSPFVFGFLGIQAASVAAAWWTYLIILAAGLLLPVLMALIPLVKTARTTVRAAIDHHGLGASPRVATSVRAWLGRIPRFDRGLLMALPECRHARVPRRSPNKATERLRWDVVVRLGSPMPADAFASVMQGVPGVAHVEGWTIASASVAGPGQLPLSRTYPDQGHGGVFVTAIPRDTTMLVQPKLLQGRWLQPGEAGAIVLSQVTLANADFDVRAGDSVELSVAGKSTTWRVVVVAEERGDASGAYVTAEGLAKAMNEPLRSNTLRIAADSRDEPANSVSCMPSGRTPRLCAAS